MIVSVWNRKKSNANGLKRKQHSKSLAFNWVSANCRCPNYKKRCTRKKMAELLQMIKVLLVLGLRTVRHQSAKDAIVTLAWHVEGYVHFIGHNFNLKLKQIFVFTQHHCRNCGHIFCNGCSEQQAQLPNDHGQITAKPVRVCDGCWDIINAPRHWD